MRYIIIPLAILFYIWSGYIFITELNNSFLSAFFISCTFTMSVFAIGYYVIKPFLEFIVKYW